MNFKQIVAKFSFVAILLLLLSTTANAQLAKVYVDVSAGNDVNNSGANPDNSVLNQGPVQTFAKALTLVANNGTISFAASTAGMYEYGAINVTSGRNLTLEARVLGPFTKVSISSLTVNQASYTITLTTDGTASFECQNGITMTNGTLSIPASTSLTLISGATVSVDVENAAITGAGFTKGTILNLTYSGGISANAGPEAGLGNYGAGVLTFNNTAGTITLPSDVTFAKIVVANNGSAKFSGNVTLGTGNLVTAATMTGGATINGNLNFTIKNRTSIAYTAKTAGANTVLTVASSAGVNVGDVVYITGDAEITTGYYDVVSIPNATSIGITATAGGTGAGTILLPTVGRIRNLGGGVVTVVGTTTWANGDATNIAANQFLGYVVDNNVDATTGNVVLGPLSFGSDKDGDFDAVIINRKTATNGGALTIGAITAPGTETTSGSGVFKYTLVSLLNTSLTSTGKFTTGGGDIRNTVTNFGTGSFTFSGAGTVTGNFLNNTTGTVNINGAVTFSGNITNNSTGRINVNETATLKGNFSDNAAAGTVVIASGKEFAINSTNNSTHTTATGSFSGDGYVTFYGSKTKALGASIIKNVKVASGSGAVTIAGLTAGGNLVVEADLNLTGTVGVTGTTTLTSGTLTFGTGAGALVYTAQDFTQTGGTFAIETSGLRTLDVNGNFSRTGGTFQVTNSNFTFKVSGPAAQTFIPGATMKVYNITFDAPTVTITVDGSLEAAGDFTITQYTTVNLGINNIYLSKNGAIAFNSGTYNSSGGGGIMFTGNAGSLRGTSAYSNIIVNLSAAPGNVTVGNENVKWTGQLTLNAGGIDIAGGADLSPFGTAATVVRNLTSANTDITVTAGTFNTLANEYNLEYIGTLAGATTVGSEFNSSTVRNLTINTVNAGGFNTQLPNAANVINGNLTVAAGAVLDPVLSLELTKDNGSHSVRGEVLNGLIISGPTATLTGYTASGDVAKVGNITLNSTTLCTVSGIYGFTGTVGTGTSSIVKLGMGSAAADQTITGLLTLGGATFTLTTNIEAKNGVTHNRGTFDFATFNVTLTTGGNYSRADNSTAVYAGTGYLIANIAGLAIDLNNGSIPNVEIKANTTINTAHASNNSLTVSGLLKHTTGAITLTKNLSVSGNVTETAGSYTGAGAVIFTGAATVVTAVVNVSYSGPVTINSTGTVTFQTSDLATPTARTFSVAGVFTQTKGNVELGINTLKLTKVTTDALVRGTDAGTWGMSTGKLSFEPAADAVMTFDPGTGWSIQNLTLNQNAATPANQKLTTNDNKAFTVTGILDLIQGTLQTQNTSNTSTDGLLHLAAGSTIKVDRTLATLNEVPTFDGLMNVTYVTAGATTGKELPTTTVNMLNNLTNEVTTTTLGANAIVNGKLYLKSGALSTGTKTLTIAAGATIERAAGAFAAAATDVPTVTTYKLVYSGSTAIATIGAEFVSTVGAVTSLTVSMTNNGVILSSDRTVGSFTMSPTGTTAAAVYFSLNTDAAPKTLTVTGLTTVTNGIISTKDATALPSTNAGTLVAQGGLTVSGGKIGNFVDDDNDGDFDGGLNLSLSGSAAQTISLTGNYTISNLTVNNTGDVTLSGGNLTVSGAVTFTKGILKTGTNLLYLNAPTTAQVAAGATSQGFTGASATSHVVGNVAKVFVNTGGIGGSTEATSVFPVGTGVVYRPASLTFNPAFGVPTTPNATIVVSHINSNPGGSSGLPIANGVSTGVSVSRYPAFYWNLYTVGSIGQSTVFDLGLTAGNFTDFDAPANVRIIRRHGAVADVTNEWLLQGANTGYDNEVNAVTGFTAINRNSVGGLRTGGAVFTLGVKSNISVKTAIAKQWLAPLGTPGVKLISLVNTFQGNQGTLAFTAQSSNPAVTTAEIIGTSVKLTPLTIGEAVVTITAQDKVDNVVIDNFSYSFSVDSRMTDVETAEAIPTEFALMQNFPNPFNPTTNIKFALPTESNVSLKIYNVLGEEVATLINKVMPAGFHTYNFDATRLSSGMYIYRIEAGSFVQVKKMLLMK